MSTIYPRNGVYQYSYFKDGKRHKKSLKVKDKKLAKLLQSKLDLSLERDGSGFFIKKEIEGYFSWYKSNHLSHLKNRTIYQSGNTIRDFISRSGVTTLAHITPEHIHSWLSSKKISSKTWNNLRSEIKTFISKAVPKYLSSNPVDQVPRKKISQLHIDFYTDKEYLKIEKAASNYPDESCQEKYRDMIVLARYCGLRLQEILNLEGEDFVWSPKPLIMVKNKPHLGWTVKNYQVRAIPLSKEAVAKLRHLKKKKGLLFVTYKGTAYKGFPEDSINLILSEAGVKRPGRAWHLLRHTFASRAIQNGVPLPQVMVWLGHGDYKTTLRYAHLAPGYSSEIEKISLNPR